MKLTIIGPDNSRLIENIANGKKVSLKGYEVFVDDAYDAYVERKKDQQKADPKA